MRNYVGRNKRDTGDHYEKIAEIYLCEKGYTILQRNYRCRMGEIDLICMDGRYLVFVEVKYRKTRCQGDASAAVNVKKQYRISRVAAYYMLEKQLKEDTPCRFDVVAIDGDRIRIIPNAFDYCYEMY